MSDHGNPFGPGPIFGNGPTETTGGSSSSSSSSSSGGSSGQSAEAAKREADAKESAVAGYLAVLVAWGIQPTAALKRLANAAAERQMSSAWFLQQVRKTKDYAKRFPGIMTKGGVMRMTEAQYISGYQSARDYAASLGRNFSKEAYGAAMASGNSPAEMRDKLTAIDKLKSFGPQLAEFNDYLVTTGQVKKPLNRKELTDFVMGYRGDLQQVWKTAETAFKLQELAGVNIDKPKQGGEIGYKELSGMIKRFEALGGDVAEVDFAKMGALIGEVIPKNQLYGAGIRQKDIVDMMLSGKNAPEIMKRVQQVMDTYTAAVSEAPTHAIGYAGKVQLGSPARSGE